MLAFEAGRLVQAVTHRREQGGEEVAEEAPLVVIVTADAGLEVVADELEQCGVSCKVVKNLGQLAELVRAMDILQSAGGGAGAGDEVTAPPGT